MTLARILILAFVLALGVRVAVAAHEMVQRINLSTALDKRG